MRGGAEPPHGRGLPRCPVLGSCPSPALRGLSVCSPSIADASGVALASIRRHNAAAFNALLFIPPADCGRRRGLARGGFAPAAQNQTPLTMPLPFTVVTARGPDGLPRLPRLRIARQRKKRKSKTSAYGALAFFFRLAPAALPRLRAWARLRRRTCRRLDAAFRLRPWRPRPSPRGGAFPPLRSGGLCAAPYGRRFFTPFAPPNKIKTFGLCVFLYACGAAFAFLISTLRRNLFVSPPSAPLSPRGERGKPIAIFLLDIS